MVSLSSKTAKLERFVKTASSEYSKGKAQSCQEGKKKVLGKNNSNEASWLIPTMILTWTGISQSNAFM